MLYCVHFIISLCFNVWGFKLTNCRRVAERAGHDQQFQRQRCLYKSQDRAEGTENGSAVNKTKITIRWKNNYQYTMNKFINTFCKINIIIMIKCICLSKCSLKTSTGTTAYVWYLYIKYHGEGRETTTSINTIYESICMKINTYKFMLYVSLYINVYVETKHYIY